MFAIGLILFFIAMALLNYGFEPGLKAKDWANVIYSGIGLLLCGGAWLAARFLQKKYFPEED